MAKYFSYLLFLIPIFGLLAWKYNWEIQYKIGTGPFWVKRIGKKGVRRMNLIVSLVLLAYFTAAHLKF